MKIVYVTQSLGRGGAERLVLDMSRALLSAHDELQIKIISLDSLNDYPELCKGLDIQVCRASVNLSILGKSKIDIAEYEKIIDEFKPDVIHSHTYLPELVCHEIVRPNIAYFSHVHSDFPEFDPFSINTFKSKLKFSRYYERNRILSRYKKARNQFITISQSVDSHIRTQLSTKWHNNIHLIQNGIDFNKFYTSAKPINLTETIEIVNVGRMFKLKNQHFLIPMMKELCAFNPNLKFKLHLLGDGPERSTIEKLIFDYQLKDTVVLHGIQQNVEDYLSKCHLYVHSAQKESFGLVIVEAMAAALPVICFNSSGPKDIVENNKNGFLMPIDASPKDFALKITELLKSPVNYLTFANEAVIRAKNFDININAEKHYNLYKYYVSKINNNLTI